MAEGIIGVLADIVANEVCFCKWHRPMHLYLNEPFCFAGKMLLCKTTRTAIKDVEDKNLKSPLLEILLAYQIFIFNHCL